MKGPLVRLPEVIHSCVFSPPGGGKSTGIIIPHGLTCPDSNVFIDVKGEVAKKTWGARARMGHRLVFLDPFRLFTNTPDTFNPLDFIRQGDPTSVDDCRMIAEALIIRTGMEKEPFWNNAAHFCIHACVCACCEFAPPDGERSLQMVRIILGNPDKMEIVKQLLQQSQAYGGILSRLGHQLAHFRDDKMATSVYATANNFLQFLDSAPLLESVSTSTFDPAQLRRGKLTVYLILPAEHMRTQSALMRLWVSSLMRAVIKEGVHDR
jgi:type IV secretion system protein VirD4